MSGPLAKLEARVAELEAASEELRDATRDAHAATKDLRAAEKAVRDLLTTETRTLIDKAIASQITAGLADYADTIKSAQDAAFDTVMGAFETLGRLYLAGPDNGPSIHETADQNLAKLRRIRQAGVPR